MLRGDLTKLRKFASAMRDLPRTAAIAIAAASAPALTSLQQSTFSAGEDAYGTTWVPGSKGQAITLRKSGALERFLGFVAIGTKLRASLGVAYAKYQIGKRAVFPRGELPQSYTDVLAQNAAKVITAQLGGGAP